MNIKEGDFLTAEQKQVKHDMMHALMTTMGKHLEKHGDLFNNQTLMDLVLSVIMMFTRDCLVNTIVSSNILGEEHEFLDVFFKQVKSQIIELLPSKQGHQC